MTSGASMDAHEFRDLARDLRAAPTRVQGQALPLIFKGATAIKKQLQDEMSSSPHFKAAAGSIDFDITDTGGVLEAEIGPDKSKVIAGRRRRDGSSGPGTAGALANIAYFGGSRGGGTVPDPQGALDAEATRLEKALADLLGGIL